MQVVHELRDRRADLRTYLSTITLDFFAHMNERAVEANIESSLIHPFATQDRTQNTNIGISM
jgi:hypothetical protein